MICIVHCWPKLAAICAVRIVCLGVLGLWGRHVIVCDAQLKHSFAGVFAWLALGWVDSGFVIVEDWLWSAVHLCVGMQILPWVEGPNVCSALYTNMYLAACMIALYWSVRTLGIRFWLAIFLSFSVFLSIFVPDCARLCLTPMCRGVIVCSRHSSVAHKGEWQRRPWLILYHMRLILRRSACPPACDIMLHHPRVGGGIFMFASSATSPWPDFAHGSWEEGGLFWNGFGFQK